MSKITVPVLHLRWAGPRGQGADAWAGLGDAYNGLAAGGDEGAGVANWAAVRARIAAAARTVVRPPIACDCLTLCGCRWGTGRWPRSASFGRRRRI